MEYLATLTNRTTGERYEVVERSRTPDKAFEKAMGLMAALYWRGFAPEIPYTYHIEVRNRKTDNLVWETNWVGVTHLGKTPPCFEFVHPKRIDVKA